MQAPASLGFESFNSKQTLFFAYLTCPSVSAHKALKPCLRFAIFNLREKLENIFEMVLTHIHGEIVETSLLGKSI